MGGLNGAPLPTGTVTLLLSDIERSTQLWERQPEEMAAAVAGLDAAIDEAVETHRGVRPVEQGEGDSFVAAFTRASDAVGCALALQQATAGAIVRLRVGIHTGEIQLRDEGNYIGPTINRAARIRDAGHGGQVLLSQTAADLVGDDLPEGASLVDLGRHRLKDLGRPEQLWQLRHADLQADHPPLRALDAVRNNLPAQLTTFVGRRDEIADVHRLLEDGRAVTLTGAGGCGKTRLAVQVAADRLDAHPGGVWFVDLAATSDPEAVAPATAEALGLILHASPADDTLARTIADEQVLLVFDNCEHLIAQCASLAESLLRRCPALVVMATSREPLGIEGEVTYRVPSLPVPADDALDRLDDYDAVQLFAERARRARPRFAIDQSNAAAVAEICRRLDGIPLAIELAAARLRVLSPAQIRDGLNDRFRLLTGGARTAVPRQQALQASVDWSYALLLDAERTVLNRLSVFAGGFGLEAAEAVCAGGALEPHHVFDLVMQLADKSLVIAQDEEAGRYTLLETVRAYGSARLVESGEAEETRARHYRLCLDLARLDAGDERGYRARITADYDNIRRALQWADGQDDPRLLSRLGARLYLFWVTGTRMLDGTQWFERVVGREVDPGRLATAVGRHALLLSVVGDQARALPAAHRAVELTRELGDPATLAWTLLYLAQCFPAADEQAATLAEALELATGLGDDQARAWALYQIGWADLDRDPAAALPPTAEALELATRHGYDWLVNQATTTLAIVRVKTGTVREAIPELERAIAQLQAAGEGTLLGTLWAWLATLYELSGRPDAADRALGELDAFADDVRSALALVRRDAGVACVAMLRGEWERAIGLMEPALTEAAESLWAFTLTMLAVAYAHAGSADAAMVQADAADRLAGNLVLASPVGIPAYARALAARSRGELGEAEESCHEALAAVSARDTPTTVRTGPLNVLASVLARTGRPEDAVRLFGAVAAELERSGVHPDNAVFRSEIDGQVDATRAVLGDDRFGELWAEGHGLSWTEAVAFAQRGRGERRRPRAGWDSLTPTEVQVVELVARGASNGEIAEKLFMAVPTVKSHLTHVYGKLGLSSRGQLTAEAARRGLAGG